MNMQDALFNWLQIRLVADARPDDRAAADTESFFAEMLRDDHKLSDFRIVRVDDDAIHIEYKIGEDMRTARYDKELAEQLLHDINANPKYNE